MRAYLYGRPDGTGSPVLPGSLIVFAESQEAADGLAASIYDRCADEDYIGAADLRQGEVEAVIGKVILADSYYGVRLVDIEHAVC